MQTKDGAQTQGQTRGHLHAMWSAVAPAWGEHADATDAMAAALTARMLEVTGPRPGDRVLELACGAGGVGLAAAELAGPAGEVVLSDVAPEMVQIAAARAERLGLPARARMLDLEAIDEPDAAYDVVLCREGLMFALDPAEAFREVARVLSPGGRAAAAVWGPRTRNPWLAAIMDAVSAQLGVPIPPPGIPGPFALDDPIRLRDVLAEAGLADAEVEELAFSRRFADFDEWWSRTSALAGPLAKLLENLPAPGIEAIRERAREAVEPYDGPAGLELPALTLLVHFRR